jgi:periplasmic protein CpxP/Spy
VRRLSILIASFFALSMCVFAMQDQGSAGTGQAPSEQGGKGHGYGHGRGRGMPTVDEQVQHMTQTLNLTSDQQSQIKSILTNERQQMEALHNDTSTAQQDKMEKFHTLREENSTKIRDVLNDDQKKKYDAMQKEHGKGMRGGMHDHGEQPPKQ